MSDEKLTEDEEKFKKLLEKSSKDADRDRELDEAIEASIDEEHGEGQLDKLLMGIKEEIQKREQEKSGPRKKLAEISKKNKANIWQMKIQKSEQKLLITHKYDKEDLYDKKRVYESQLAGIGKREDLTEQEKEAGIAYLKNKIEEVRDKIGIELKLAKRAEGRKKQHLAIQDEDENGKRKKRPPSAGRPFAP